MDFSVSKEAYVFLWSVATGAVLFLLYDLLRIVRRKSGAMGLYVHVQDGVFWLASFAIMFFVIFHINSGILRFYELFGAGLGAVLYGLTLSKLVTALLDKILEVFSKIFKFFLKILLTPLFFVYNILYRYVCLLFKPLMRLGKWGIRRICNGIKRTGRLIKKK